MSFDPWLTRKRAESLRAEDKWRRHAEHYGVSGEEFKKIMASDRKFGPIGRVVIDLIQHADQRYETAGDWFREHADRSGRTEGWSLIAGNECVLHIRASRLRDDPGNFFALAVAYHELGEAIACIANGIDESAVDQFDVDFKGRGEPGDDPRAPYSRYHNFATACESILIGAMGKSWGIYEKAIESLPKWKRKRKK
jgi:hypothetical protein